MTMAADDLTRSRPNTRSAPEVVAPTNRINVALPFARIEVTESSKELADLAGIVNELVAIVEASSPSSKMKRLRDRAAALNAQLG
jgi:hypothetical protein